MEHVHARHDELPGQLTLHVGDEELLLDRARPRVRPNELVVAPVELHKRNVQRRLRERSASKGAFEFEDPVGASRSVLDETNVPSKAIDRIDRLALVRSLLTESESREAARVSLPPGVPSRDPQSVEQLRTEVEALTNFHPERVGAWRSGAESLYEPIDAESERQLDAALDVERALRERTSKAVSEAELVRRATRAITATEGSAWSDAYPEIERLTLVGVSSLSAPHADLVHSLLLATSLEIHVHFRRGTGEFLRSRTPALLDVTSPGREVFE
ncbi:hypothetical protein [Haloferax massiliensis]|uniref:Uncharacterized protein n=1 Tax=Haloferax massiliensis TaxID=1476858 RepID=A0A0D6JP07_9EURY|nr:hypothetical protein [Haloferax massiliensis]CQR49646.1 hypothetical protein BN996_01113 [Haloferax massiliensis]